MKFTLPVALLLSLSVATSAWSASLSDLLKKKPNAGETPVSFASLSQEQVVAGLRDALTNGVRQAVTDLGKEGGFLQDASVKIPLPENAQKIEKVLRAAGQGKLVDNFVSTMNRAAEQAVPEAATVLAESVKQMSIADAKSVLSGTDEAATQYFRRTSETNLHERFLPIVKAATAKTGVTSAYKQMSDKAGGALGGMLGGYMGGKMPDLDSYITAKALDGLFVKIAAQEKLIRASPVARTTDILKKVFGAVRPQP
ncbi:MAG: DUF4197 domain-containing protein [Opitutus sp.]